MDGDAPQVPTAERIRSIIAALQPKERHEAPVGGSENAPWMVWEVPKKMRIETVVDYYWSLRVLVHVWGKVGCHMVDSKLDPSKKVWCFDFNHGIAYADQALRQAMFFGGGFPHSLQWIESRDLKTRTKMMELQRLGHPPGEALTEALLSCREDWQSAGRLAPAFQASEVPQSVGSEGPGQASRGSGRQDRGKSRSSSRARGARQDQKRQFCTTAPGGKQFCRDFQNGKCARDPNKCPHKALHRCNVKLPSGKACMSKTHGSSQHRDD